MDTVWISHWKYSGVYCNHFLPTPWGDFSQRQHGNYFKSINCKSLPRQINTFPPGVQGDRHRNCYSLILCIAKHSTEGIFANSGPWLPILDVLRVGGEGREEEKQSSPVSPAVKVCVATVTPRIFFPYCYLEVGHHWLTVSNLFVWKLFQQLRKPLNKDILWPAWLSPFLLGNAHLIIALPCLQAILLLSRESQKVNTPLASC